MSESAFYRIVPDSPAATSVDAFLASRRALTKAMAAYAKKWLPQVECSLRWFGGGAVGFSPVDGVSWNEFTQHFPRLTEFWVREEKDVWYLRPRKIRGGREGENLRYTEFEALPKLMTTEALCLRLFKMRRFVHNDKVSSMGYLFTKHSRIVQVPWLAAAGYMDDFGPGQFVQTSGLIRMGHEDAMLIWAAGDIAAAKKQRKQAAKDAKERKRCGVQGLRSGEVEWSA